MESSTVAAAQTATAAQYNDLREDVLNGGDAATSTGSANAYLVALDAQITAYAANMLVRFKANFTNTGAATVNVNSIGAKTIKKLDGNDLSAGDIISGMEVILAYDGTNLQMLNPPSAVPRVKTLFATQNIATTGTQTISGVGFRPKVILIQAALDNAGNSNGGHPIMSNGSYDGTTQGCVYSLCDTGNPVTATAGGGSGNIIFLADNGVSASVNGSAVAGNIGADGFDLVWSKTSFPTGTVSMIITCIG